MNWLLIGTLLGSIITSSHDTREACEGRAVILREKSATVKCVENTTNQFGIFKCSVGSNTCGYFNN